MSTQPSSGVGRAQPGALLTMTGIDKSFGGVPALRGADFSVGPAEVHALIGQNGAGKSTLIKVLTGYHRRDAGSVMFDGQPFEVGSPQAAQAAGISTIYQEINLVGLRSVSENICLGREPKRFGLIDWKRMHETARGLLARFSIDIDVRRSLDSFSTATQQMVAIARALGFKAKLVIMDEPTSSLDDREVEVLFDVIRQIKREGVSVVFVSHKLDELYAVCDRVTIMRDGTTVRAADMSAVNKLDLVATMLGRDLNTVARQGATAFGEKTHGAHRQVVSLAGMKAAPRVQDATLEVGAGEIVGLAGLLGAGRTETVRLLFGADHPDAGEIRLDGQPFAPKEPIDAIGRGIGFCTEDRKVEGIVPELSVRENLTLALLPHLAKAGIVDEAEQGRIVEKFIKRLGVKCASPDQPIRELSGGNQQKVLLARWLCMNPKLLILDEPTRGIDVGAKAEIQSLIRELARDGLAVLMVSSEVEEIIEGSDRAYVMRDGRTVASLSGDRLNEHEVMGA
ncbi:MAG TPA: sugar ABC transporter ATP-binding protein, partial [Geminicoccus sp.]|uniref:sugar ABC transporter ATP-binding protein n=1 Tax=Geminicoccus sp. TaxID=2024832 RepID=UPI002E33692B